ncbi:MBL fold metallo-hydrolase [Alteribacillus sp. HJP-4]|uniref:MBL fold metallo-hydrolase n=1 Tax=Alteribacillus sp. HJP-4 TaxID=2775394 RepID=UPI0035CCDBEE
MKVIRISEHIFKLETWAGIKMSAWAVKTEYGSIIIDAGLRYMGAPLLKLAEEHGPLQMILLTHGHSDHTGGIQSILKMKKTPVYIHPEEIPYATGKSPYPGRKKKEKNVGEKLIKPLPSDEAGNMYTMMGLLPIHTPGHSPGHTVYYHERDNILIGGDLFTSRGGRLAPPISMFTADMDEAVISGRVVKELNPALLSITHGEDIEKPGAQYEVYRGIYFAGRQAAVRPG